MQGILIPLLVLLAVLSLGGSVLLAMRARRKPLEDRLRGLIEPPRPVGRPLLSRMLVETLDMLGGQIGAKTTSQRLREDLARAGFHHSGAAKVYMGAKLLALVTGAALAGAVLFLLLNMSVSNKLVLLAMAGGSAFFVPNIIVRSRSRKRCEEVRLHLPDALDLLEICISAGMGLDTAWNAVTEEIREVCPVMADEMALTNLEMHLGAPRAVALRHMAERSDSDDLSSLVAIMVQSERFGTSIASALQTFAASMRQIRSQRAEEKAEKMAVKLIVPMVAFIFPAVMIVLVGPAGITLSKIFGS